MSIRAVLFDLDGTLLHTVPDLAAATNAMLQELGRETLPESRVAEFVGKGAENLIHRSLTGELDGQVDTPLFNQAMPIWKRCYAEVNGRHAQLYDGVFSGLERMKAMGLSMGVVTNKPEGFAVPLLERTGLSQFFELVIGGDSYPVKKPDPLPIVKACERLNSKSDQTVFIGDSLNDSQAAAAAGVACWLLPYGYNEGRPITQVSCQAYVTTLDQVADLLVGKVEPANG